MKRETLVIFLKKKKLYDVYTFRGRKREDFRFFMEELKLEFFVFYRMFIDS